MVGEKRGCDEVQERLELGSKRPEMRDVNSVFRSQVVAAANRALDLNADVHAGSNPFKSAISASVNESNRFLSFEKYDVDSIKSRGFGLDLNAEDVSSYDPFCPYKNYEHLKSRDESECGSSVGPLKEKDPMRVWKEMKENGFLSSSHGGFQMPKPRVRKIKSDGIKKRVEIAKREQVDKFSKIAAPSGLLNGLNPGIINHVRNSKQVHSIIEALVRSEKIENRQPDCDMQEYDEVKVETESTNRSVSMNSDLTGGDGDSYTIEPRAFGGMPYRLHFNPVVENDTLALKLSSSTKIASENTSSLTHEESANATSVTSLSVKAANVASQWLELLNQDIKGRLSALRRSKKRVRSVIQTELPYVAFKEFSSSQDNNQSDIANAEAHHSRWASLFHQMENTLSDEEKQLENQLNQVKEMQSHCERGLLEFNATNDLAQMVVSNSRSDQGDSAGSFLPVRAAAASIYSTCNFLSLMENLPCR